MPIERKLVAIMFTDIAGYTALSAKDETKALNLLDTQKKILTPIIEEFNGTLHKEMGDGLLFTFPTVTEAVKCGITIQEKTKDSDDLNLRIGIHEGEITLKDGDVLGDDVNVASRIEPFSAVGGIAISGKVQQNISSLTEFGSKYIGKPKLKGVAQKVEVYCISSHGLSINSSLDTSINKWIQSKLVILTGSFLFIFAIFFISFTNTSIKSNKSEFISIGVMLYDNKGERQLENLAFELTEDTIIELSKMGEFIIPDINKVKPLGSNDEIEMNYILIGSISENNNKVTLKVRLLNGQSNVALLGEKIIFKSNESDKEIQKLAVSIYNAINPEGGRVEFMNNTDIVF